MSPLDLFSPSNALNPAAFTGETGAARLMDAAHHFPGGPTMLVFALFWAPVGPGIPAGVLLARHVPLGAAATFGLYTLSDFLGACFLWPLYVVLRRHGRNVRPIRWLGRRILSVAMIGAGRPGADGRVAPALFRIATVGFGVDIYTAGALATALPVPRIPAWLSAITGDLIWFAFLLGSSIAAAAVIDDDRVVGVVVLVAMIVIPKIAQRVFPALRPDAPASSRD